MAQGVFYTFWFEKNLQGDVVAVYNETGTKLISYAYDAWGNFRTTTHNHSGTNAYAAYNPFRYRGYYYDDFYGCLDDGYGRKIGFYYLNSRYYNPEWGRFINADACLYSSMLGFNLFAYCENNSVNYIDPYGESGETVAEWWITIGGLLPLIDGPSPVLDIVYVVGCVVCGAYIVKEGIDLAETIIDLEGYSITHPTYPNIISPDEAQTPSTDSKDSNKSNNPPVPDVKYPGDDPTVPPGPGYEWKGKQPVGSDKGAWVKDGESMHPDLNHPDPIGPHWDYNYRGSNSDGWRIYPNGNIIPK